MALQFAETAGEGDLRCRVNLLIADCDDTMVQKRLAYALELFVVVPIVQIGARYFGPEYVRQGGNFDGHVSRVL